jgi:hypothetical protein
MHAMARTHRKMAHERGDGFSARCVIHCLTFFVVALNGGRVRYGSNEIPIGKDCHENW